MNNNLFPNERKFYSKKNVLVVNFIEERKITNQLNKNQTLIIMKNGNYKHPQAMNLFQKLTHQIM